MDMQISQWCTHVGQWPHQVAVQFHGIHAAGGAQQFSGNGALARADLYQILEWLRGNAVHYALDDAGIMQEVLAESFASTVIQGITHLFI